MPVKNRFAEMLPEITAWRHDFHQHPELLYEVHRTAARVAELCRSFGCDEVVEGVGVSGVVVVIKGKSTCSGRTIGLRADMDALPITEITGAPYASKVPGRMHACGHDGHTAMLLGAAKYLAETRNFDGTVVCIFQPAEEGGAGGRKMVEDGLLTRWKIDEVYGLHNVPGLPVGSFAIRPGAMMAAADEFVVEIIGKGGHAAKPQNCIDPVVISAHVILAAQSIASRSTDPLDHVVVSICTIGSDSNAHNVIPGKVQMRGTVRTLDPQTREFALEKLRQLIEGTARTHGAEALLTVNRGYPVTINHAANAGFAGEVARQVSGREVEVNQPMMAAEDFSYMLNERPGAYIFLGNGDTAMLHHAAYDFDDAALPFGCSWYAGLAEARLPAA
ncbi:M20 aminoacylase family protein [Xinfangfangia sp. CPCC 101601]|uniref:M20 aminoacylase family protein n=1 Tax=Pseudogemmobacter lacusdianii TaxID=3069608 RepID=A0ABU0VZE7_9RHOB|nr:M20 aminoacylase family protein [Xinfangfangia sp. CPCC 101601]MDQ2066998.1 M20 aminoacylase family protein [Xinfangfangia sp. CPCC 101601]